MKLLPAIIHKTKKTVSLRSYLTTEPDIEHKQVAFYIRGEYFSAKNADNLYNRIDKSLPPTLPKGPKEYILSGEFANGDIPCFIVDRGVDIEVIVE